MVCGIAHKLFILIVLCSSCVKTGVSENLRKLSSSPFEFDYSLDAIELDSSTPPSVEPSAKPSAEPTAQISHEPSVAPTISGSAKPTHQEPTKVPTQAPNSKPTRSPSRAPTALPTPLPGDPTLAPTVYPTITPTNVPTAVPSIAPTKQASPILKFEANITMGGLVSPTLDLNAQRVVVNVTASSMRLSANTVRYVNGIATAENRRLASGVSLFSTTYSVVAVTEVNVPLTTATSSDPAAYYASLTALLTEAVVSGQFTEDMARVALLFNATVLESAQATAVSNGNVQVVDPSSSSSTDDEPLDDGGISGVVIGGFIFLILVAAAAKHFLFANTSFRIADVSLIAVRSSSSSGNGTQMVSVVPR